MITFLTSREIMVIHERMIASYGGLAGCADRARVESMVMRIINRHLYENEHDIFNLAAAYLLAIARGHCFNDANKRTAFAAATLFLRRNGISLRFSSSHENLTVEAAQGLLDIYEIASVLRQAQ